MKKPVWHSDKKGSARENFVAFSAGRDVVPIPAADSILVPYDIWTNQAHAVTLYRAAVFTEGETKKVLSALNELLQKSQNGGWELDPGLEDVHINIEAYITDKCGEAIGGRLHSGRSRNDQVANDMRLYARDVILLLCQEIADLQVSLMEHAGQHLHTVMPGYTHHRKATITSWAHWCASYIQGLERDAQRFMDLYKRINTCPLGAAASYGTTWPLDRELTAELMAFDRPQENTLDAVMSRGEAEAEIVQAAAMLMKRLSVISQDLILFSTEEFGFLSLPSDFTTGSSIMPQKRNPDFAEAIKGKTQVVIGFAQSLMGINASNLSGYNKDVQWTKYQFMDAVRETCDAAIILGDVFEQIIVHKDKMESASRLGFLNAVDFADFLARSRNVPFRSTYRILSDAVGLSKQPYFELETLNTLLNKEKIKLLSEEEFKKLSDPQECLKSRDHAGSPNPKWVKKNLANLQKINSRLVKWVDSVSETVQSAREKCAKYLK